MFKSLQFLKHGTQGAIKNNMSAKSVLVDLELFLVGLIMAGTMYCEGPVVEDPTADFDLWRVSWDTAVHTWNLAAREQGWHAVGMSWEYHDWESLA